MPSPLRTGPPLRQCSRLGRALLVRTGRMTRLGLSRWAGTDGRDRPIQRLCATVLPWGLLVWVCCRPQVDGPGAVDLVAGDDVIGTHAGHGPVGPGAFRGALVRSAGRRGGRRHAVSRACPGPALVAEAWRAGGAQRGRAGRPPGPSGRHEAHSPRGPPASGASPGPYAQAPGTRHTPPGARTAQRHGRRLAATERRTAPVARRAPGRARRALHRSP